MPLLFTGYPETTLSDFPALVRLPPEVAAGTAKDGVDLRFAGVDGEPFDYDIDTWNPEGESLVWVRVPRLAPDTPAYVYWGNPRVWPQNQEDTWSRGFAAVWHLNDKTSGNLRNAVRKNLTAQRREGTAITPGVVGNSVSLFNGGYLRVADDPALNVGDTFTVSGWFKLAEGLHPAYALRLFCRRSGSTGSGWEVDTGIASFSQIAMRGNSSNASVAPMPGDLAFDTVPREWRHITVQYKGQGKGAVFVDGVKAGDMNLGNARATDLAGQFTIGAHTTVSGYTWPGQVDEVRIETVIRHDAWVRASFDTVVKPDFVLYGAPEAIGTFNNQQGTFNPQVDFEKLKVESSLLNVERSSAPLLGRFNIFSTPDTGTVFTAHVKSLPAKPTLTLECGGEKFSLEPVLGANHFHLPKLPRNKPNAYAITLAGANGSVATNGAFHVAYRSIWRGSTPRNPEWRAATNWSGGIVPNGICDTAILNGAREKITLDGMANLTLGALELYGLSVHTTEITATNTARIVFDNGGEPARLVWCGENNGAIIFTAPLHFNGPVRARGLFSTLHVRADLTGPGPMFFEAGQINISASTNAPRRIGFPIQGGPLSYLHKYGPGDLVFQGKSHTFAFGHSYYLHPLVNSGRVIFNNAVCTNLYTQGSGILFGVPGSELVLTNAASVHYAHGSAIHFSASNNSASNCVISVNNSTLNLPVLYINSFNNRLLVENGSRVTQRHGELQLNGAGGLVAVRGNPRQPATLDIAGRALRVNGSNNHLLVETGGIVTNGAISVGSRDSRVTVDGGKIHATQFGLTGGVTIALRPAPTPAFIVDGDVDFRPGATIIPLNPDNLKGTFPLLKAKRIHGLPTLDDAQTPGATIAVSEDLTTVLLTIP